MLLAETAILAHFQAIRIVLLVLDGIVIALLALAARQRNLNALIRCHFRHLLLKVWENVLKHAILLYHMFLRLSTFSKAFKHI